MAREIKFMAWSKYTQRMYWFDLTWGNYLHGDGWIGMLPVGEIDRKKRVQVDPDDCDFMQFTGLYDKNGKEIYEGDVFRIPPDKHHHYEELNVVEYSDGVYSLSDHGLYLNDWNSRGEVIGNIYENPELLEK